MQPRRQHAMASLEAIRRECATCSSEDLARFALTHATDPRVGVRAAIESARRRLEREEAEMHRLDGLATRERLLSADGSIVAGVDEVGRGALAGPVVAAACVFARDAMIIGLNDSKRLSPKKREQLSVVIHRVAVGCGIGSADPAEIDLYGIASATVLAMKRALAALPVPADHVLVDGLPVAVGVPATAIVRGDSTVRSIAAASVVAKVHRDALMRGLGTAHPGYGFAENKGYGSADHLEALAVAGPCEAHRRSFSPCSQGILF